MENKIDISKNVESEIIIYQTEDGHTKIDVKFEDETVWLTQAQLCELYQTSKSNISEHIKHIFEEGELEENSVFGNSEQLLLTGKNIIQYIIILINRYTYRKGFTMDDERLKNLGGGNYWKELLDRIRDIRSSEKVMYRQVLDLYATSVDYDPKSSESIAFLKWCRTNCIMQHMDIQQRRLYTARGCEPAFYGIEEFFW